MSECPAACSEAAAARPAIPAPMTATEHRSGLGGLTSKSAIANRMCTLEARAQSILASSCPNRHLASRWQAQHLSSQLAMHARHALHQHCVQLLMLQTPLLGFQKPWQRLSESVAGKVEGNMHLDRKAIGVCSMVQWSCVHRTPNYSWASSKAHHFQQIQGML